MRTVACSAKLRLTSGTHPASTFGSKGNRSIARLFIRPEDIQEQSRLRGRKEVTDRTAI